MDSSPAKRGRRSPSDISELTPDWLDVVAVERVFRARAADIEQPAAPLIGRELTKAERGKMAEMHLLHPILTEDGIPADPAKLLHINGTNSRVVMAAARARLGLPEPAPRKVSENLDAVRAARRKAARKAAEAAGTAAPDKPRSRTEAA
jgi:hypothetical protein